MSDSVLWPPVVVRPARPEDAADVARIYGHAVRTSMATFDLVEPGPDHFTAMLAADDPTLPVLVATVEQEVVGYAYAAAYRVRPAYARTRETSIYLAPGRTGLGIGRRMYADLLGLLDAAGVHTELAVVALPNDASEALHRALGFRHVGTMREVGRKFDRWVDTAWYQRPAPDHDGRPPHEEGHGPDDA